MRLTPPQRTLKNFKLHYIEKRERSKSNRYQPEHSSFGFKISTTNRGEAAAAATKQNSVRRKRHADANRAAHQVAQSHIVSTVVVFNVFGD